MDSKDIMRAEEEGRKEFFHAITGEPVGESVTYAGGGPQTGQGKSPTQKKKGRTQHDAFMRLCDVPPDADKKGK